MNVKFFREPEKLYRCICGQWRYPHFNIWMPPSVLPLGYIHSRATCDDCRKKTRLPAAVL